MAYFTYIAEECLADAKKYGGSDRIEKISKKITKEQTIAGFFAYFPRPFLVRKKFPLDNLRLICVAVPIDEEDEVICFLRILKRGSHEYVKFAGAPAAFSPARSVIKKAELFVRKTKKIAPPPPKKLPKDEEKAFLYEVFAGKSIREDIFICESS